MLICVPNSASSVERRAIRQSALAAGAREVKLIEESMAAAIGANLSIEDPAGSMVVDIGGGASEVAVFSLGGIVFARSIRVGVDKMNEAIVNYMRRQKQLLVGEMSAERIKKEIGTAKPPANDAEGYVITVRGRGTIDGVPKEVEISERMVAEALSEPVDEIIEAVKITLESIPAELSADIVDRGIVLTGPGAMLRNIAVAIQEKAQLPVTIAEDPLKCAVIGSAVILENFSAMKHFLATEV